ncbi:hypothetical protein BGX34_009331 [Mortierella sp. NVP85]|nr:hypothetical protein BGX34_009331 [Mortierella sp. NVP85]
MSHQAYIVSVNALIITDSGGPCVCNDNASAACDNDLLARLIPQSIKIATGAGIGLYLMLIGAQSSAGIGLIAGDKATLVTLTGCVKDEMRSWSVLFGGYMFKNGDFDGISTAFFCDATAISSGACFGVPPITAFIESGARITEGDKTGLPS